MNTNMNTVEQIYKNRYDDLVKFARSRLKNPDKAEEVVQEAFVYLIERQSGQLPRRGRSKYKQAKPARNPYTVLNNRVRALVFNANLQDKREIPLIAYM